MSTANDNKRQQLIGKLREMFQMDQANLDFGIYRILRCEGLNDPKLRFFETIKDIEAKLGDKDAGRKGKILLRSFVVSNTPLGAVRWWEPGMATLKDFAERHVLFQKEAGGSYVSDVFARALSASPTAA